MGPVMPVRITQAGPDPTDPTQRTRLEEIRDNLIGRIAGGRTQRLAWASQATAPARRTPPQPMGSAHDQ